MLRSFWPRSPATSGKPAEERTQKATPLRGVDFTAHSLGDYDCLIQSAFTENSQVLPSWIVSFLDSCRSFQPIEKHLDSFFAENQLEAASSLDEIRHTWIPSLRSGKLLISEKELHEHIEKAIPPREQKASISSLAFITRDNPSLLEKSLSSFAENLIRYGHTPNIVIIDNSSSQTRRAPYLDVLDQTQSRYPSLPLFFAGREEKLAYCQHLAHESGCPREIIEFALFDTEDTGFACGANRNAMMLHAHGECYASLDDDICCDLARIKNISAEALHFGPTQLRDTWVAASSSDELQTLISPMNVDYLAAHTAYLGRHIGSILKEEKPSPLHEASTPFMTRLCRQDCHVVATVSGLWDQEGHCVFTEHIPHLDDKTLSLLCENDERYRQARMGGPFAIQSDGLSLVSSDIYLGGAAFALDQRKLLPPFFPVFHGEDNFFAGCLGHSHPASLIASLPLTVHHAPPHAINRPQPRLSDNSQPILRFLNELMRIIIRQTHRPLPLSVRGFTPSSEHGIKTLGLFLSEVATLPPADFSAQIRQWVQEDTLWQCNAISARLDRSKHLPKIWQDDLLARLRRFHRAIHQPSCHLPEELLMKYPAEISETLIQRLCEKFGLLLQIWPDLLRAAADLREKDIRPAHVRK